MRDQSSRVTSLGSDAASPHQFHLQVANADLQELGRVCGSRPWRAARDFWREPCASAVLLPPRLAHATAAQGTLTSRLLSAGDYT